MKNAAPLVALEPTALVAMSSAHRAIHLSHGGWRTWQKLAGFCCYIIYLLVWQLAKRLWVESRCRQMFNLGKAYGAKVGLKLRLEHAQCADILQWNATQHVYRYYPT